MKKITSFLFALTALTPSAFGETETVPSLVVGHYYGVDSYPVHLSDYNHIEIGEDHYTLKANNASDPDIKLSYSQYPKFWVEDVAKDIPTSVETVAQDIIALIEYSNASQSLASLAKDDLQIAVFNIEGKLMLSGILKAECEFPVASLPAGIFVARAADNTSIHTIKFIKI